LDSEWQ